MLYCVWGPALHSPVASIATHILSSNAGWRTQDSFIPNNRKPKQEVYKWEWLIRHWKYLRNHCTKTLYKDMGNKMIQWSQNTMIAFKSSQVKSKYVYCSSYIIHVFKHQRREQNKSSAGLGYNNIDNNTIISLWWPLLGPPSHHRPLPAPYGSESCD